MSEGWAKESRRAGTAEYVTKDKSLCGSHRAGAAEYVKPVWLAPKNKAPKLINNEYKLTIEDLKLLTKN